ncbi:uncharacterized protein LOC122880353 isoform X2 [Siniperca chuatsi]|nr:uncharacterized protein LOC122880353 isoform X2 [Siniperca chuatsi]
MEGTTGTDGDQEVDHKLLMSSKPLHRFVQKEPKCLGIVILIFGCAELLMGFQLASESVHTACQIPFWQGVLFLICGIVSIYTEVHPSKKMVTVCLVSVGYRIYCLTKYSYLRYMAGWREDWSLYRVEQLFRIEGILFTSSLCVSVLLIFLCTVARLTLRSTHTQVIVQRILAPPSDTTSN